MNGVTRSGLASGDAAVARVAALRVARPNGWWGMLLFLAAEATLFGGIIATYFYLRFHTPVWPPPGIKPPSVAVPAVLNGVLVATTLPMLAAARAARAGLSRRTWALIGLATFIQTGYFAMQVHLFQDDLGRFKGTSSAYGSVYFTMLGLHHAHVLAGIVLDLGLLARLLGGLTNYRLIAVRSMTLYWYVVNALAVCVLLTQLYPSL